MHAYPRLGRVIQRLGNMLPDVSGEINARRLRRASTEPGLGVTRLGLTTFLAPAPVRRPRVLPDIQSDDYWR